jgi:hypothetical protein
MASDDHPFPFLDHAEEFGQAGFGFVGSDGDHRFIPYQTGLRLV